MSLCRRTWLVRAAVAACFLICAALTASGGAPRNPEPAAVSIRVTDLVTGGPIVGARLTAGEATCTSDVDGHCALLLLPGVHDVHARAEGYIGMTAPQVEAVNVEPVTVDFAMIPSAPTPEQEAIIKERLPRAQQELPADMDAADLALGYDSSPTITDLPATIRVLMPDGSVVTMAMDEYLRGVLPYEMGPQYPMEALKAQAVAARSYAATTHKHGDVGADVCTTTHCQVWKRPGAGRAIL